MILIIKKSKADHELIWTRHFPSDRQCTMLWTCRHIPIDWARKPMFRIVVWVGRWRYCCWWRYCCLLRHLVSTKVNQGMKTRKKLGRCNRNWHLPQCRVGTISFRVVWLWHCSCLIRHHDFLAIVFVPFSFFFFFDLHGPPLYLHRFIRRQRQMGIRDRD